MGDEPDPTDPGVYTLERAQAARLFSARRGNLYRTHRNLYLCLMTVSVMKLALALNFWFSRPTFRPYHIPQDLIGCIFFALGSAQIVFLNVYRNLRLVRLALSSSISFLLFWGMSNTQQGFQGKASFQLPLLYVALAGIQFPLLVEPAVNPATSNGKQQ